MQLTIGAAFVDLDLLRVERGGEVNTLTQQEARLLHRLCSARGAVVDRDTLLQEVWDFPSSVPTRAVDNALYRLRAKIEADPKAPVHLLSVRGRGYRLVEVSSDGEGLLFGRTEDLRALTAAVGAEPVWLCGLAGVGKTAVAKVWADRVGAQVLSLQGVPGDGVPGALAQSLGLVHSARQAPWETRHAVRRALTALDRPVLIDSAENALLFCQAVVAGVNEAVLTSRIAPSSGVVHTLRPLGLEDASRLFCARSRAAAGEGHRVAELLGGLPLALELAAGWAEALPVGEVVAMLEAGARPVVAALTVTWSRLHELEQRTLAAATTLDTPEFSRVLALVGADPTAVAQAHRRLAVSGLLPAEGPLDEVRAFVLGQDVALRLLAASVDWVAEQGTVGERLRSAGALAEHAPSLAVALWASLSRKALLTGPAPDTWLERAAALDTEHGAEVRMLQGAVSALRGRHDEAILTLDAVLATNPRTVLTLEAEIRRAWSRGCLGHLEDAIRDLESWLEAACRQGLPTLEAMAAVRLGSSRHRAGDVGGAVVALERALGIFTALGDPVAVARCSSSIGLIQLGSGALDAARENLEATVAIEREHGVTAALAQHLLNLGGLELVARRGVHARRALSEAVQLCESMGDAETGTLARLSEGIASLMLQESERSIGEFTAGRVQAESLGNPTLIGVSWLYLGIAACQAGDPSLQEEADTRAREILAESPLISDVVAILEGLRGMRAMADVRQTLASSSDPFLRAARLVL